MPPVRKAPIIFRDDQVERGSLGTIEWQLGQKSRVLTLQPVGLNPPSLFVVKCVQSQPGPYNSSG